MNKEEKPSCENSKEGKTSQQKQNNRGSDNNTASHSSISKEMTIDEMFETFPHKAQHLGQELKNAGLNCVGCHAATWETLEMGMLSHGFNDTQIDAMIEKLNIILKKKSDKTTITMTKSAADKYRELLAKDGKTGYGIRLGDKPAGCSGFEYVLDFSEKATENDTIFHSEGFEIHVDKNVIDRMMGCEIDYVDGLNGAGFKISNPNVTHSCHCGRSQSY